MRKVFYEVHIIRLKLSLNNLSLNVHMLFLSNKNYFHVYLTRSCPKFQWKLELN